MSDAQLIQYLHGELSDTEHARIAALVARTPSLGERLRALRERSERLSVLLGSVDPTPDVIAASARAIRPLVEAQASTPVRWWRASRMLQAAAIITFVLAGALSVEPVRAWIIDQARAAAASMGLIEPQPPAAPAPVPAGSDVRVSFAWSSTSFEILAGSIHGAVEITPGPVGRVTAELEGSAGEGLTILPGGIRIDGTGSDAVLLRLVLPTDVRTVTLRHSDGTTRHEVSGRDVHRLPLR